MATGQGIGKALRPSVDLPHYLVIYPNMRELRGIIHTRSCYATAFSACHKPMPLCLTAVANKFRTEVPCTPYVDKEGNHIGEVILKYRTRAPAILLGNPR